jgi:hypothetical protein
MGIYLDYKISHGEKTAVIGVTHIIFSKYIDGTSTPIRFGGGNGSTTAKEDGEGPWGLFDEFPKFSRFRDRVSISRAPGGASISRRVGKRENGFVAVNV